MAQSRHSSPRQIKVLDTTLRDGAQRTGVHLTLEDKLRVLQRLEQFGVDYIEAGFPAANPVDAAMFAECAAGRLALSRAHLVAFGMTRRKGLSAAGDEQLQLLAELPVPTITLVGKAARQHVERILETSLAENLAMVEESVAYLVKRGKQVLFAAEHFFDGYKDDIASALQVVRTAAEAGAEAVVLCDTNGGSLPWEIEDATRAVCQVLETCGARSSVGIHAHDDCGCAVANTLAALYAGADLIQGTVNGYGERAGNANLLTVLANMQLKTPFQPPNIDLSQLTSLSLYVAEVFNIAPDAHQPYTGSSAFAHKGGMHSSAVEKWERAYEHIDPAEVGNSAHIVVSDLAGKTGLAAKARELGYELSDAQQLQSLIATVKGREAEGYSYEMADASLALLIESQTQGQRRCFELESFRVIADKRADGQVGTEATVKIHVGGERHVAIAEGNGPVNALDKALRMAIERFYPEVAALELTDYKVRVLDASTGTSAVIRVLIETSDGQRSWGTVGVSENIIEASWDALVEAITYGLTDVERGQNGCA
ncbi:MAG: citramalate synthase [Coriobacteriales bacterium]|jgi:2-isopropylmalate synthase|nr:citramalate synthase [Coriobacteriales bacterium]